MMDIKIIEKKFCVINLKLKKKIGKTIFLVKLIRKEKKFKISLI